MKYLGRLQPHDPLYDYLKERIFPHFFAEYRPHQFRVFQFPASNEVFLYEETHSRQRVIGKFFGKMDEDPRQAWERAHHEWQNMHCLRHLGFNSQRLYIPQPLGIAREMNSLLVEEYCAGQSLSNVIAESIRHHDADALYARLTDLAYFLAKLHNWTVQSETVCFDANFSYFDKIMARLQRRHRISAHQTHEIYTYREHWRQTGSMWSDRQVLIHGDATPANFLFAPHHRTIAIDLERMKATDRAYDLGMIAGEIKHHFIRTTHHGEHAEPFIGHFLWEYSTHFPDRHAAFTAITERIPFYMGMTLLRIARNSWLDWRYSQSLVHEATHILRR